MKNNPRTDFFDFESRKLLTELSKLVAGYRRYLDKKLNK